MTTEITDNNATATAGWVCYDGECAFCLRWLRRVEPPLLHHGFGFVPLQTPWVKARLNVPEADLLTEMRLLLPNQRILGGADAAVVLAKFVWWLWPLWLVSRIPGVMPLLRNGYHFIAKNRHWFATGCKNGKCIPRQHRHSAFFEMP